MDLRGGDSTYKDGDALKSLYANREMLVAVATQAKGVLEILDQAGTFTVSKEALRSEFPTASVPSPTANTGASDASNAPKSPRKPSKRSR